MDVFTITADDAKSLESFFSKESLSNIGKEGYYTIGVYDDEGFIAGVMQFLVDFNQDSPCFGLLSYMFIHEDFRDTEAAQVLVDEFERILSDSGINDKMLSMPASLNPDDYMYYNNLGFKFGQKVYYVFSSSLEAFVNHDLIKKAGTKNIKSISELNEEAFYRLQKAAGCNYPVRGNTYYDMKISSYFIEDEGCGLFLVKKLADDSIITAFLGCSSLAVEKYVIRLLSYTAKKALDLYGPDALVNIHCKKNQTKKMISMLFPDMVPSKYTEATIMTDESNETEDDLLLE